MGSTYRRPGVCCIDLFNGRHSEITDHVQPSCGPIPDRTETGVEYQQISIAEAKELGTLLTPWVSISEGVKFRVVMRR